MYFVRIPGIVKSLYPSIIWDVPDATQQLFLTFDDGPHPEITPWVLKQLKKYDAKATFFCLGKQAENYPELVQQIKAEGHRIGSHGYAHLNGWKTNDEVYHSDVMKSIEILPLNNQEKKIFRPPYGKIKKSQLSIIHASFSIINWSLMPGDFDASISSEKCLKRLLTAKSGDIIVLHDNKLSRKHVQFALPAFLAHYKEKNYTFDTLDI
jgi:peptidoglycan-N-acetylglucosamine deacetylase